MSTLLSPTKQPNTDAGPQIPPELLDIFRSEAEELLQSIERNLELLAVRSADEETLWEIRRNAHTLKGAAGAVGIDAVVALTHLFEDVVDRSDAGHDVNSIRLLADIAALARSVIDGSPTRLDEKLSSLRQRAEQSKQSDQPISQPVSTIVKVPQYSNPALNPSNVARVSLLKIDDCRFVARNLLESRSVLAEQIDILKKQGAEIIGYARNLQGATSREAILKASREFSSVGNAILQLAADLTLGEATNGPRTVELSTKLDTMRMIAFGTIAPRLMGAVRAACEEAGTRAEVIIEDGETEIDTVLLADMAEPLLHLLRNSAVHGIETPEERIAAGKPETGKITLRIARESGCHLITISDDGRGINVDRLKLKAVEAGILFPQDALVLSEPEALKLIFLEGISTARSLSMSAGRGVGMRIVKESVESKQGSIAVDTLLGCGTIFTVTLPFKVPGRCDSAMTEIERQSEISTKNGIDILIVDDSPSIRYAAARTIESRGWHATTAGDGKAALDVLSKIHDLPAVIVSDVEMPEMDGFELVANLKNDPKLCGIPVVICSSRQDESFARTMRELQVSGFVAKPFTENDLIEAIENAAGS